MFFYFSGTKGAFIENYFQNPYIWLSFLQFSNFKIKITQIINVYIFWTINLLKNGSKKQMPMPDRPLFHQIQLLLR